MSFMTCLFLVLWFLFYEHSGMKAFFKNGIRFALCSLLSAAMAAIVLVPAYIGIMKTSSAQLESDLSDAGPDAVLNPAVSPSGRMSGRLCTGFGTTDR